MTDKLLKDCADAVENEQDPKHLRIILRNLLIEYRCLLNELARVDAENDFLQVELDLATSRGTGCGCR